MEYLQYKELEELEKQYEEVLNLIINGIPSIRYIGETPIMHSIVLNLIINGIPSIRKHLINRIMSLQLVLNLIINGIPSIQ